MCCENEALYIRPHKGHQPEEADGCDCAIFGPAFWSRKEKIERLEKCLAQLKQKAKEVEERIGALKTES
jgi:hypothetical protein